MSSIRPAKGTLLITGANGFVGQYLIKELRDSYKIIAVAGKDRGVPKNVPVTWELGDIADGDFVTGIFRRYHPQLVIHLAAKTQTWFKEVKKIYDTNVLGTINIYEGVLAVRTKNAGYNPRIVYVSSSEVYGKTPNPLGINEDAPLYPVNPYGASKASADRLSYAYSQAQKLDIIIARPFTHTGPGQSVGFFVPDMISQIVAAEKNQGVNTIMVGNLEAIRDYLDVRDVVRAYKLLLTTKLPSGEAYNICSGEGIKVSAILDQLIGLSSKELVLGKDKNRLRPSDVDVFIGNNSKIRTSTGWEPMISLAKTLSDTLADWRSRNN